MSVLAPTEHPDTETLRVPVVRVFDGDGFLSRFRLPGRDAEMELSVRLGFIDAPEMEQPGGAEAREFLARLIHGCWVELVVLTKMNTGGSFDRHGRIVAVPYVADPAEHLVGLGPHVLPRPGWPPRGRYRNVELEMIANGWAWVLDRYEPPESYYAALEDAQRHRRGLWARDDAVHPWSFKTAKYRSSRQPRPNQPTTPDLFAQPAHEACPTRGCGGRLVRRTGKFGPFLGCSEFPTCRYSRRATD